MKIGTFVKLAVAALALSVAASCHQEYSLDREVDLTVSIGGDSLTIPLGTTDTMGLFTLIDTTGFDYIETDGDGNLLLHFTYSLDDTIAVNDYVEDLSIDPMAFNASHETVLPPLEETGNGTSEATVVVNKEFRIEYSFEEGRDDGLKRLDSILFSNAVLSASMVLAPVGGSLPEDMEVRMEIATPERYNYAPEVIVADNIVTLVGDLTPQGEVIFSDAPILSAVYEVTDEDILEFSDRFVINSMTFAVPSETAEDIALSLFDMDMTVAVSGNGGTDEPIYPELCYGTVDRTLDEIDETYGIDDVPSFLKDDDVSLDFYAPYILADASTNSGIPLVADISVSVIRDMEATDSVNVTLLTPSSPSAGNMESEKYWISRDEPADIPGDYTWVMADINSLLRKIPDDIRIRVAPRTDPSESHVIDCNADYILGAGFDFVVPFSFGEELNMIYRDTITGLDDISEDLTGLLQEYPLRIGGTVTNTFPVDLELCLAFLDASMRPTGLPLSTQTVGGMGDGPVPVVSDIALESVPDPSYSDVSAISVEFRMTSGPVPGQPFRNDSYIMADLNIGIPGGIELDLNKDSEL